MIRAEFFESKGKLCGFRLCGHAGFAESGEDIVCASVSSAVQLTANLLEALKYEQKVDVMDNVIKLHLNASDDTSDVVLDQLRMHLEAVLEEFPNTIKITTTEV